MMGMENMCVEFMVNCLSVSVLSHIQVCKIQGINYGLVLLRFQNDSLLLSTSSRVGRMSRSVSPLAHTLNSTRYLHGPALLFAHLVLGSTQRATRERACSSPIPILPLE